jgi:predicted AAA+ superfamily ATPase
MHRGFLPRIWDKSLDPAEALAFYIATYVERDLRAVHAIKDLSRFQRFLTLCAGRTGQLLNAASLASDVGVSPHTIDDWISLLQAGFIVFLLRPWHENLGKRLVKAPKLYFWDVGLAAWLLGNRSASHIAVHPLRGSLFENFVIADTIKRESHRSGGRAFNF